MLSEIIHLPQVYFTRIPGGNVLASEARFFRRQADEQATKSREAPSTQDEGLFESLSEIITNKTALVANQNKVKVFKLSKLM